MKNQRIVLINLSSVELLVIVYLIIILCGSYLKLTPEQAVTATKVQLVLYHGITVLFYLTMIFISADRFSLIMSPTKYHTCIHKSTLKKIIAGIWSVSFGSSIPFAFNAISIVQHIKVILYISYAAQAIFLLLSIITYTMLAVTVRFNKKKLGKVVRTDEKKTRLKKIHLVPFLIISTFILFYAIPQYVTVSGPIGTTLKRGVTYVGLLVDPIIYIFSQKPLRRYAVGVLTCNWCRVCKTVANDESNIFRNRKKLSSGIWGRNISKDVIPTELCTLKTTIH